MRKSRTIKIILFALIILAISLCGCGKKKEATVVTEKSPQEQPAPIAEKPQTPEQQNNIPTVETPKPKPEPVIKCDNPASPFTLADIEGKAISLSNFKGKVVIIDFWTTWCAPCKMSIPILIELQKTYGIDGLQIIGISLDERPEDLPGFSRKMGINYIVLRGNREIAMTYENVTSIPTIFIVDRNGCIVGKKVGWHPKSEIEQMIKPLLKGGSVTDTGVPAVKA